MAARKAEREFGAGEAKPWWQVQGKTGEFSAALEAEVQRRREALAIGPEKPKTTAELMGQPSPRELFSGATKVKPAPQKSGFATIAESIAWISGRTTNELLLEQNVKQTDVQQQMKDALDRIEKNTSNPKPVKVEIPQGAVFARQPPELVEDFTKIRRIFRLADRPDRLGPDDSAWEYFQKRPFDCSAR
ncbi:MAG: hypothetical protein EB117_16005 [Betaproteobacteria bacterium]|nr:hypothetical protein [Betaproteobacteria bacterium]